MKSYPGNIVSHFFFFTTQGFDTFQNQEIAIGVGAIYLLGIPILSLF